MLGAVSNADPVKRPFVTRLFQSTAIKSWDEARADPVRHALSSAVEAMREGHPVVVDFLVDIEAELLEPIISAAKVLHWRSRPSKEFGARVRRALGFYSGESTLAAAVVIDNAAHLESILRGEILWDCEFTIYPQPTEPISGLPDPHFDISGFATHVGWSLNQDSGSDSWLVTGLGAAGVDMVCATLSRTFSAQGLVCSTAAGPVF
jgi:hypothetical protein